MTDRQAALLNMTAGIVANYLQHNRIAPGDLPGLISLVHQALAVAGAPAAAAASPGEDVAVAKPTAAQIRKSITETHLISFEDGKPYRLLKRTLAVRGLTMAQYREKWGLPRDYPSTAPAYSARRSELAKARGFGTVGRVADVAQSGGDADIGAAPPEPAAAPIDETTL